MNKKTNPNKMRACRQCGRTFTPDKLNSKNLCDICVRDNDWKRRHGITPEEYAELFNKQNGRCAICGKPHGDEKTMLSVDHDHTTGKIRGLLCKTHNLGLGMFGDDARMLANAISYLKSSLNVDEQVADLIATIELLNGVVKELQAKIDTQETELNYIRQTY